MADFNSSLPVRTEAAGDVIAKIADATTPSQQLAVDSSGRIIVKLTDGSGNSVTSQINGTQRALDVGINVSGVQIDPRSIRALTATDIVTANQGSAAATASAWPIKVTDGTSIAAIKAASTAALAADPSLVVAFSPNSPLPTGSNVIGSVNQGTSPWITKDQSDGPVTPGAVASFSQLMGGQFNTSLPTLTTGQQAALQVDSSGRLLISLGASLLGEDHNFGTVGANTLRAAAQIGNATGAADFNAGATGAQTLRTVSNQGAPNTNANAWFTRVTDGTNNATVTAGGALNVTVASALPTGANTIGNVGVTNLPTTVDTNYGTVGASTLRGAAQIGNATGAADFNAGATGAQTLRVVANQGAANATPWNQNVSQFGGNAVVTGTGASGVGIPRVTVSNDSAVLANIQVAGSAVSASNPVPVTLSASSPGTTVQNYNTVSAVAASATSNHDYTVTAAKTLSFDRVWASSSGKLKIEVQIETGVASGVFNTRFVAFNSTANPNIDIDMNTNAQVAAGVRVRIIRTNKDNQAQDVYSTVEGSEI